jgi:uncharacterized protein (UPF0332 family)
MASDEQASRWREVSRVGSRSARLLFENGDYRGCANRAYYAAYHAATAVCVIHGDEFVRGWNNPSHELLPELIQNNGDLPINDRRHIRRLLRFLNQQRVFADYRPGRTINKELARECLVSMRTLMDLLEANDE